MEVSEAQCSFEPCRGTTGSRGSRHLDYVPEEGLYCPIVLLSHVCLHIRRARVTSSCPHASTSSPCTVCCLQRAKVEGDGDGEDAVLPPPVPPVSAVSAAVPLPVVSAMPTLPAAASSAAQGVPIPDVNASQPYSVNDCKLYAQVCERRATAARLSQNWAASHHWSRQQQLWVERRGVEQRRVHLEAAARKQRLVEFDMGTAAQFERPAIKNIINAWKAHRAKARSNEREVRRAQEQVAVWAGYRSKLPRAKPVKVCTFRPSSSMRS